VYLPDIANSAAHISSLFTAIDLLIDTPSGSS
jgi:hypothetical protein